jgi:hypothetical protein
MHYYLHDGYFLCHIYVVLDLLVRWGDSKLACVLGQQILLNGCHGKRDEYQVDFINQ